MKPRHLILGAALVGVAVLAFLPPSDPVEDVVEPVVRRAAGPAQVGDRGEAPATGNIPGRPLFKAEVESDLFPTQSFRPPPPPPPPRIAPAPPPPPMAPPLPFGYVGAWTENGQETYFLSQGDRVVSARVGMSLAGGWRLDQQQTGTLLFTYEPLNQQRTLRIAP